MLTAFARAFRTPDLRKKLLFTLAHHGDLPARVASSRPRASATPTCRPASAAGRTAPAACSAWSNLFSGGALLQLSIFALGIMPYITASIIVQLLTVVIPRFEALKKEGQSGTDQAHAVHPLPDHRPRGPAVGDARRRSRATRRSCSAARLHRAIMPDQTPADDPHHGPHHDRRHRRDHVARRAHHRPRHRQRHVAADLHLDRRAASRRSLWADPSRARRWGIFVLVILHRLRRSSALVVFVEQSQRRIPVQYAKRMIGRRMYGGTSTYIPLKVNMAGVIPVIFASSLLYLPGADRPVQQPSDGNRPAGSTWIQEHLVARRPPDLHGRSTSR